MPSQEIIRQALQQIFAGINELKKALPGQNFTIDGRLVGDIGEAIAQRDYDITLYPKIEKDHDGQTSCGKKVQIKATFKDSLTFKKTPDFYLGIKINEDGSYEEIYNGPGKLIETTYSHRKGIGKELLSFKNSKLNKLSSTIPPKKKIKRKA